MKKVSLKQLLLAVGISFLTISCQKELGDINNITDVGLSNARIDSPKDSDKELVLGKKLKNPFTIENMTQALENLKSKSSSFRYLKIEDNYVYVRLLPNNLQEFDALNMDSTIDLFDYPLDYEIKTRGNKYKDLSLGNSNFTWIYCSVPKNKKFPNGIKVEVLSKLWLPWVMGMKIHQNQKLNFQRLTKHYMHL